MIWLVIGAPLIVLIIIALLLEKKKGAVPLEPRHNHCNGLMYFLIPINEFGNKVKTLKVLPYENK
jgi:hypothetical protein